MLKQLASNILAVFVICFLGCGDTASVNKEESIIKSDTLSGNFKPNDSDVEYYLLVDTLSKNEKGFLSILGKENPAVFFVHRVNRFYATKDSTLLFSRLDIPNDVLIDKGYVSYNLSYWGEISDNADVHVLYDYNQGQADYGFGSVYGPSVKDYFHSFTGYGLSAKVITVYNNGTQLYSQTIELTQ